MGAWGCAQTLLPDQAIMLHPGLVWWVDEGCKDMLTCFLKGSWRPIIHLAVPFNHCLPGPYLSGCPRGVMLARALPNSQAI